MKKLTITLSLAFLAIFTFAQTEVTIYEIQGQQAHSPYDGEIVKTTGIVTGVFSGSYFIQDGEGEWNGVYVYGSSSVAVGDEIELIAEVDEYYDLTELKNISSFTLLSSGNELPEASVLDTWGVNDEAYEGVLVKVEDAACTNDNVGFGEWELNDGSGPCRVDDMGVVYSPAVGINYSVTGPLQYSYDFYKIEPRDENDIVIMENLYFTSEPEQINLSKVSITLKWETNVEATTEILWGPTPELQGGHDSVPGTTTNHEIELTGMDPSNLIYIRAMSKDGPYTTANFTRPYTTVSNSTGDVNLYFNHDVDYSVAGEDSAVWTPNIADTVIHYINMAQQTLDITMYEQESYEIVAAINAAYESGIDVRYITDDEGVNTALDSLNENIPVLYGNVGAIMHDKFIIIDVSVELNAWVVTGSLNHTNNNLGWDFNNMICIQDKSLAIAYTLEFEEMWGSEGLMYDEDNAKFGHDKTDNTPHKFFIDSIPMEAYFSPSDKTTSQILNVIEQAESSIEFGLLVFTENSLGTAIVNAHQNGIDVAGIVDYVESNGSEYNYLVDNGVNVLDYVNPDGSQWPDGPTLHHKYSIMDFEEGLANPVAITGSHNWSASGESVNDENTLIIYDANIANQFHQEFSRRYKDLLTPIAIDDDTITPENEWITINYLDNDYIPEEITVSQEFVQMPNFGEAAWVQGEMTYNPQIGFNGLDSLSYRLYNIDGGDLSDTAWVRIWVGEIGVNELTSQSFAIKSYSVHQGVLQLDIYSNQSETLQFRLIDLSGKLLYNKSIRVETGSNSIQINLASYSKGILLMDIAGQSGRKISKIVY